MSKELRRDRHTVPSLSDRMVSAPKYRRKILAGDVAMVAKGIICKACKKMILRYKINIMQKTICAGLVS